MRIEWRAILFGAVTMLVLELFAQLALVLLAAYYGNVGSSMTLISAYKAQLWFSLGLLIHAAIMFLGGWLTAQTCEDHQPTHALLAAFIASVISSYWSMTVTVGEPTLSMLWFFLVAIASATTAGWLKHWRICQQQKLNQ